MSDWEMVALGELGTFSGGVTSIKREDYGFGTPFLTYKNVYSNWRVSTEELELMNVPQKDLDRKDCRYGDVFFTASSETEDEVAMSSVLLENVPQLTFNGFCKRFRPHSFDRLIPSFAVYWFRTRRFRDEVYQVVNGDTRFNINQAALAGISMPLPSIAEQEAIAEVLSSLDDKIDLLKRQNKTLEGMAEALFRQWFIEEAQDDWEEVSIYQVGTFLNGLACQNHRPTSHGSLPVLKIRDLRNGLNEDSDRACAKVDPKYIVEAGDLIFSWSGTLEVKIWDGARCVLNQHLFKVTSEDFPRWYMLLWCQHHLAQWRATAEAHATTMGHIKRSDLKAAMVVVPSDSELSKMDETMSGIMARIDLNNGEISSLVKQRNILLPKLMSGEFRVQKD